MEEPTAQTAAARAHPPSPGETLGLALGDCCLRLPLPAVDSRVTLSQLVAPARAICDQLVDHLRRQAGRHNRPISCRKGCSACCRYLVPLSVPEALLLPTETPALTRPRAQGAFLAAARNLLRAGSPPALEGLEPHQAQQAISDWYVHANVTCPFLANSCCQVYPHRPLACREHLALSNPDSCSPNALDPALLVACRISVTTALSDLAAELEGTGPEAVMLPLARLWWHENRRRNQTRYPAQLAIRRLGQLLQAQTLRPTASSAA
ncbi:MAG: YkgJ family cysteine cluster protein [Planctomycetota bacterium]|nr:YkgJ family cysteine cluster protein [Planctomycetota bacterium]